MRKSYILPAFKHLPIILMLLLLLYADFLVNVYYIFNEISALPLCIIKTFENT